MDAAVFQTPSRERVVSARHVAMAANSLMEDIFSRMGIDSAVGILKKGGIKIDRATLIHHGNKAGIVSSVAGNKKTNHFVSIEGFLSAIPHLAKRQKMIYGPDKWVPIFQIAKQLGVDHSTLIDDVRRGESKGNTPNFQFRTGIPPYHDTLMVHPDDAGILAGYRALGRNKYYLAQLREINVSQSDAWHALRKLERGDCLKPLRIGNTHFLTAADREQFLGHLRAFKEYQRRRRGGNLPELTHVKFWARSKTAGK